MTAQAIAASISDTPTEETMLHPKFEEGKMHGIGIFKIGASVETTIGELRSGKSYLYDTLWSRSEYEAKFKDGHFLGNQIIKVNNPPSTSKHDEMEMAHIKGLYAYWCDQIECYYINQYLVDSVLIKNIELTYYKNKLICIFCEKNEALSDAITAKFGKRDDNLYKDRYVNYVYLNGDIQVMILMPPIEANGPTEPDEYKICIHRSDHFLGNCWKACFAAKDSIDKANKAQSLKNL